MKNTHLPFSKLQVKLQIHLHLLKIMVLNCSCSRSCYYTANLYTRVKCRQIRPQFQLRRPQNLYIAAAIPIVDCNLELCLKSLVMEREHVQCGIVVWKTNVYEITITNEIERGLQFQWWNYTKNGTSYSWSSGLAYEVNYTISFLEFLHLFSSN